MSAVGRPRDGSLRALLRLRLDGREADESRGTTKEWLRRDGWRIYASGGESRSGEELLVFDRADGTRLAVTRDANTGTVSVPFSFSEALRAYLAEEWVAALRQRRIPAMGLDGFYRVKRLIPRGLQLLSRRALIAWQRNPEFPTWPLDDSVVRLASLYAFCRLVAADVTEASFAWFWPEGYESALVLTHDVEGEDGLRRVIELADLEEEAGFRSSFNLGAWYSVDRGVVSELRDRGFEVGLHGLRHDRSMFSSRPAFEEAKKGLHTLARRFGAVGFRSPATHRVHDWLGELGLLYDCSIPNSDPYEPQPGGCCAVWPFFNGSLVELPYTLPQDHTLLTLLGRRTPDLWVEQADRITRLNGLIQCVSHPDAGYLGDREKRAVYREFLAAMADRDGLWRALPCEVAEWWNGRADGTDPRLRDGVIRLTDRSGEVEFLGPRSRRLSLAQSGSPD